MDHDRFGCLIGRGFLRFHPREYRFEKHIGGVVFDQFSDLPFSPFVLLTRTALRTTAATTLQDVRKFRPLAGKWLLDI